MSSREEGALQPQYAIRTHLGEIIFDGDWTCPADVMRSSHGFTTNHIATIGDLVRMEAGVWTEVYGGLPT